MTDRPVRARLPFRVVLVALILPLLMTAVGAALLIGWRDELPDPIAVHWGVDGANGFGPLWANTLIFVAAGVGLPVLFSALLFVNRPRGFSLNQKILTVASLFATILIVGIGVGSAWLQLGLEDAADAPDILPVMIGSFAVAAAASLVAWFALPKPDPVAADRVRPVEPIPLAAEERAVWFATTRMSTVAFVVLSLAVILVVGLGVFALAVTDGAAWPLLIVPVLLLVAIGTTTVFRVRVDATGLTVRAALGWPVFRVPLDEVASVGTVDVDSFAEFGGWGLRSAPGRRLGIVLRSGTGIEVTRRDGRSLVVTVDDAERAAALLAGYVAARRSA